MGGLTALAVVVVAYTLVASKLDRWWITAPMVFVAAGAILGPGGLDVLPFSLGNETVLTITELTLALLLFSDASTVRLRDVEGDASLPRRLLFVGLPLTVVAGALAGLPPASRGRVGGGGVDRHHPGAHRCGARPGRRHQPGRSGADPAGAQRRERSQRRDRDAVRHPVHRGGRGRGRSRRSRVGARGAQADRAGDRRRGRRRVPRREAPGLRQRPRLDLRGIRADRHPRPRAARVRGIRRDRRERVRRGFAGGILFGAATRGRLEDPVRSPRRSGCPPRSWSGRSSARCSSESCSPTSSRLDPSSTRC